MVFDPRLGEPFMLEESDLETNGRDGGIPLSLERT